MYVLVLVRTKYANEDGEREGGRQMETEKGRDREVFIFKY